MKPTYTPRPGTLPSMVIGFFCNNHDEYLALDDITDKFDCTRGNIHTQLGLAMEHGLLIRQRDEDGQYIYKRGPKCPKSLPEPSAAPRAPATKPTRSEPACKSTLPDPLTVELETGVPIETNHGNYQSKSNWGVLLERMSPGQSCKLPLSARHMLANAVAKAHKAQRGRFTTRLYKDAQCLRIWRVS